MEIELQEVNDVHMGWILQSKNAYINIIYHIRKEMKKSWFTKSS
jgi:hypothetical protein